jgi:hypothetical protein
MKPPGSRQCVCWRCGVTVNIRVKLVIVTLILLSSTGCLAGGPHPRRDAYETLSASYSIDLARRVTRDQAISSEEIEILVNKAVEGDQNILFCLLSNEHIPIYIQKDAVEKSDGWGLQGIGYNKNLYYDPQVRESIQRKTSMAAKSVYQFLWVEKQLNYRLLEAISEMRIIEGCVSKLL